MPAEESNHRDKSNGNPSVSSGIEIQIFCLMKPSIGVGKENTKQRNDNNVSSHCAWLAVPSGAGAGSLAYGHHLGTRLSCMQPETLKEEWAWGPKIYLMLKQSKGTETELATGTDSSKQGDKPHTSCVGSLFLAKAGFQPQGPFFFSAKHGLKYCMQETAFLGGFFNRKLFYCIKIGSCHVPAIQTLFYLLLK